jgi:hypothetical protein
LVWSERLTISSVHLPSPAIAVSSFSPALAAIGKDRVQPREKMTDRGRQVGRAIAVLDIGGVHLCADQMAVGIGDNVRLRPLTSLPAS